jgi:hypothetical protein
MRQQNGSGRTCLDLEREEVTRGWRKLHNEFHNMFSSPNIIKVIKSIRMIQLGHVMCMGKMKNAYQVLVGKPEGKRQLGRSRSRWEDNIKMTLK